MNKQIKVINFAMAAIITLCVFVFGVLATKLVIGPLDAVILWAALWAAFNTGYIPDNTEPTLKKPKKKEPEMPDKELADALHGNNGKDDPTK